MFTGLVEEVGTIKKIEYGTKSSRLTIEGNKVMEDIQIGDSIAVNGVCLTASKLQAKTFTADVMAETMRRTALGDLVPGSKVNLERAMAANGRFGGHIVSGHIDGTGTISHLEREENAVWVTVQAEPKLLKYIVEKGSVALNGISLTVAYVDDVCFRVSIIPHTASETTLLTAKTGSQINIECDILGKYVEKLLRVPEEPTDSKPSGISTEFLAEHGFF